MNLRARRIASLITVTSLSILSSVPLAANEDRFFSFKSSVDIIRALGADKALPGNGIVINMEAIAENPSLVPIEVQSNIPGTERISIIVDNNPTPLAAVYKLTPGAGNTISARLKMRISSKVRVVVHANGKVYASARDIKVTDGGCGSPNYSAQGVATNTTGPGNVMIRGRRTDKNWTVMGIIEHPMETGLRKIDQKGTMVTAIDNRTGKPVPPHYIREVSALVNGKTVLTALWGPSIAADPQIAFDVRGKAGDRVTIAAIDNMGLKQGGNYTLK